MALTAIIIASLLGLFIFWRFFFFFRNPPRKIPYDENHVLSPADGRIIYIKRVCNNGQEPIFSIKGRKVIKLTELMHLEEEKLKNSSGYLIGVFMSPFNVHFNRAPISGYIKKVAYDFPPSLLGKRQNQGMFNAISNLFFDEKPYWKDCDYLIDNERASYVIKNERQSLYVVQIAENWVKRIVTYKDQQPIRQGEVFGLIRMGSQVDIFIPDDGGEKSEVKVVERQKVKAGQTVLVARSAARE
jgi:phosphatidylserine decarboxylase